MKSFAFAFALLTLVACDRASGETPRRDTAAARSEPRSADPWAGRWNGVDGGYIEITPADDSLYAIFVKGPAGPAAYQGRVEDGGIRFGRAGTEETIVAATGGDTGMPSFAGKAACVTVTTGESYCRD